MEYPNGDVYDGEWRDDIKWGSGRMQFGNGRADQAGIWERGVFHEGIDYVLPKNCPKKAAKFFGEESQLDSWVGKSDERNPHGEESVETKYTNAFDAWENTAIDRLQNRERTKRFYYGGQHVQAPADEKDCAGLPSNCPPKAAKLLGQDAALPADCPKKAAAILGCSTVPGPMASMLHPSTRSETKAQEDATECIAGDTGAWCGDDYYYAEGGAGSKPKKFGGLGSPSVDGGDCKVKGHTRMSYEQAKDTIRRLGETSNV